MALTVVSKKSAVHAESIRVGIRLAFVANNMAIPPPDVIERILAIGRKELEIHEFPLELVSQQAAQRREMRRAYAIKALEVLLQKGDPGFGEENPHERIVDQAWAIAAQMERHDNSGLMLDVVGDSSREKR